MITTEAKERSLTLSTWEVRAILERRKSQFRCLVIPRQSKPKVAPLTMAPWLIDGVQEVDDDGVPCWWGMHPDYPTGEKWFSCPYGKEGDLLWIKEAWAVDAPLDQVRREREDVLPGMGHGPYYCADKAHEGAGLTWKSPAVMPRWASRIELRVESVRVERLQDITEENAEQEGILTWAAMYCSRLPEDELYARAYFELMWNQTNRAHPWESNDYVWAISFDRADTTARWARKGWRK